MSIGLLSEEHDCTLHCFLWSYKHAQRLLVQEQFPMANLAVWLPVLLLEHTLAQLAEAEGADKVLWVELVTQSGDTASGDGGSTAAAEHPLPLMEVQGAQGPPTHLKETPVFERLQAVLET